MKTTKYQDIVADRLSEMSAEQRVEHDAAYERAGLALRLAELFYDARTAAGLTQTELARRMHTTQPTIARIEGGGRMPTLDMLERLAVAVGRHLDISLAPVA